MTTTQKTSTDMSPPKILVVIGATGTQGGSVVKAFLGDDAWKVRGITRNTLSAAAQSLSAKGVEMISADLDDQASLVRAFHGATAIFSVTDFWAPYATLDRTKLNPGQGGNQFIYEYELRQGKNVFDAAARTDGLERLIFSSLSDVTKLSEGKYKQVYHFDSKAHAVAYGRERYPDLWKKTSIIQVGFYLSNWLSGLFMMLKRVGDDQFEFVTQMPGNVNLPFIATEEDTGPLVKILVASPAGKNVIACRENTTIDEFVAMWGRVLGVKVTHVTWPSENPWPFMTEEMQGEFQENIAYIAEYGYSGGDESIIQAKDLDGTLKLGSVEEWVRKQDWSKILPV